MTKKMPLGGPETALQAPNEPWEHHPTIWKSQAAFFAYLRGGLRLIWSRYPPKLVWKKSQMVAPPKGYTGRAKSMGACHYCKEMFAASHLEVDHVQQAGSCNSWETQAQFLKNLLDCNGNWVLACKPCHKVKSYAERTGTSFEDALLEKRVISTMKLGKDAVLDICEKNGYNRAALRNDRLRREALTIILKGGV